MATVAGYGKSIGGSHCGMTFGKAQESEFSECLFNASGWPP